MRDLNNYIEHTALSSSVTSKDIEKLCAEAAEYHFVSVCVNPCNVRLCKRLLVGTGVSVCTVIGFPLGSNCTEIKASETKRAYEDGCDEFDMVINVGALKDGRIDYVGDDIAAVVEMAKGKTVKVIIETGYLTDEEKITACRLAAESGARYVKTCTGFGEGRANEHDVKLMRDNIPVNMMVKASAGIRTKDHALKLIAAGADRLGTSAGVQIVNG